MGRACGTQLNTYLMNEIIVVLVVFAHSVTRTDHTKNEHLQKKNENNTNSNAN